MFAGHRRYHLLAYLHVAILTGCADAPGWLDDRADSVREVVSDHPSIITLAKAVKEKRLTFTYSCGDKSCKLGSKEFHK